MCPYTKPFKTLKFLEGFKIKFNFMDFLDFFILLDQITNPIKAIKSYWLKLTDKNEYKGERFVAFLSLILLVGFYFLMGYILFFILLKK